MTLPSSGTISMQMIQTEFGGSNPIGLNEYYRGGANVPNTAQNTSIPTSGTISLNQFYGTSSGSVVTVTPSSGAAVNWTISAPASVGATVIAPSGATLVISGGTPPYTWAWSGQSGSAPTMSHGTTSGSGLSAGNVMNTVPPQTVAGGSSDPGIPGYFYGGGELSPGTYVGDFHLTITDHVGNSTITFFTMTITLT